MSMSSTSAHWRQSPERSHSAIMKLMVWISLRLGRRLSRGVLHGIAAYFLLFSPRARRASALYLRRLLGRPARIGEQYRHFLTFASTVHDRIYLLNDRFDLFDIRIVGESVIRRHVDAGRGILLMGGHLGSFEAMRAIGRHHTDLKVCMVMYAEPAAKLSAVLAAINPAAVQDIVPLGQMQSMLELSERLEAGQMAGMLCDRNGGDGPDRPHDFLGTPAAFPLGPFRLAAMLRRPVVFMTGLYLGGNRYEIHFEELADFSNVERASREAAIQTAQAHYVGRLESFCRYAPFNWFNFFDFWQPATRTATTAAPSASPRP
ncbi:MAG: acyl-CoA synthetase [Rhodocyclaceae bacterium]|nr:acyl-CoA synthetase [Rhodocyclaceae bacterium]